MVFDIVPFERDHVRKGFDCGNPELNNYLLRYAGQDVRANYASLFVAIAQGGDNRIWGYYTLSNTGIELRIVPETFRKSLPKYKDVPAIRLGRLAVDAGMQGQRLGIRLLANAVIRSVSNASAWAVMVVDAKDDVACVFYRKFGFESLEDDERHLFAPRADLELNFRT